MNHLVDPDFQGVNRLFKLSFENEDDRRSHREYHLPKVTIKDYNIMIGVKNFLINQEIMMLKYMKILEKLLLVKEMIIQLVAC